jgi:uncharacterized protein (DUF1499 family)
MAQATRWWSKAILVGSIVAFILIALGALGTRFGIWPFTIGLLMFAAGALLALIGLLTGLVALIVVLKKGLTTERSSVVTGLVLSLVVAGFTLPRMLTGGEVPAIHNISTDVDDPPKFSAVMPLRGDKSNPVEYDAAALAEQQRAAYPWVKPLETPLPPDQAFDRSMAVLKAMGIDIVDANAANGTIEGTATSFWFGFKDDIVVRIRPMDTGSRVDLHSVSRVGVGDVGMNAKRIGEFLERFPA